MLAGGGERRALWLLAFNLSFIQVLSCGHTRAHTLAHTHTHTHTHTYRTPRERPDKWSLRQCEHKTPADVRGLQAAHSMLSCHPLLFPLAGWLDVGRRRHTPAVMLLLDGDANAKRAGQPAGHRPVCLRTNAERRSGGSRANLVEGERRGRLLLIYWRARPRSRVTPRGEILAGATKEIPERDKAAHSAGQVRGRE